MSVPEHVELAQPISVFLSYAWESETHKQWVAQLAARIRGSGFTVLLDQTSLVPGDHITHFMERGVRDSDFVLVVCTPEYKRRADGRISGVGYEGHIITAEIYATENHRKFIPILPAGAAGASIPTWASGKVYIAFSPDGDNAYRQLVATLLREKEAAGPASSGPALKDIHPSYFAEAAEVEISFDEIYRGTRSGFRLDLDGKPVLYVEQGKTYTLKMPEGEHEFGLYYEYSYDQKTGMMIQTFHTSTTERAKVMVRRGRNRVVCRGEMSDPQPRFFGLFHVREPIITFVRK